MTISRIRDNESLAIRDYHANGNGNTTSNSTGVDDTEREVWEFMTPEAWYNSVGVQDSIFAPTYVETRRQIEETAKRNGHDVILEVGCGTGDVIGFLQTDIPCIGVDINKEFVEFCKNKYNGQEGHEFYVADALELTQWWMKMGFHDKYNKPLVTCVNNTLNMMPENMRGSVVDEMLTLAGPGGLCLVTYWNGNSSLTPCSTTMKRMKLYVASSRSMSTLTGKPNALDAH